MWTRLQPWLDGEALGPGRLSTDGIILQSYNSQKDALPWGSLAAGSAISDLI